MSDSATLEKVVNEIIIDKGWDKEFIKKGEKLGLKKGEEKGKMETARKLLLKGFNIEEVIELTDLTLEQVKEIQRGL